MKPGTDVLHIVADPRRQQILRLVWENEALAGDIARSIPDITSVPSRSI